MGKIAREDVNQDEKEFDGDALSDVLSQEVLGPIKRTLELWDAHNCGGDDDTGGAALYGLRDAYILAAENMRAICDTIKRDIGDLQIDAPWGENSFLERRSYKKAFLRKSA